MDYAEQILALSEELGQVADKFAKACEDYSTNYYQFQRLLGTRIMALSDKKPSMEKIIAENLSIESKDGFNVFYRDYITNKALKEGYTAQMEALKSRIMARQSIMRYNGKMDSFGEVK